VRGQITVWWRAVGSWCVEMPSLTVDARCRRKVSCHYWARPMPSWPSTASVQRRFRGTSLRKQGTQTGDLKHAMKDAEPSCHVKSSFHLCRCDCLIKLPRALANQQLQRCFSDSRLPRRAGRCAGVPVFQLLPRARVLISTILALLRRQITTMKDTSKDENHDAVYFELHQ